ncbi:MAG: helix-turn-helix domain-containing protein [Candidatus Delongbacteria bacterium]|nr:helix-turn-helix domain-containing protein [Candidatus Delongbacteria bacterium]
MNEIKPVAPGPDSTPEQLATFFTVLASPVRIRLISILNLRDACLEELAELLQRRPATIHHHLAKLAAVGLVTSMKKQYYRYYSLRREQWGQLHNWLKQALQFNQQLEEFDRDFRQSVFAAAFGNDRFNGFPPQQRDRELLQRFFLSHLREDRSYNREELTIIFSEYDDDLDRIVKPLVKSGLLRHRRGDYCVSVSSSSRKNLK